MRNITELTGDMVGKNITLKSADGDWVIQGRLWGFQFSADRVPESRMSEPGETYIPGRRSVTVQIGPWSSVSLPGDSQFLIEGVAQ